MKITWKKIDRDKAIFSFIPSTKEIIGKGNFTEYEMAENLRNKIQSNFTVTYTYVDVNKLGLSIEIRFVNSWDLFDCINFLSEIYGTLYKKYDVEFISKEVA